MSFLQQSTLLVHNGKSGWPWADETDTSSYNKNINWPKISIITPSYNQGQFIEETIRSVIMQNYPNLEYIIIDGGSTDNTVEIIKKYESWITYWISERDHGQSEAINKGFRKCTGDIIYWLNSDDCLKQKALYHVALNYNKGYKIIHGKVDFTDKDGNLIRILNHKTFSHKSLLKPWVSTYVPSQSGIFFASSLICEDWLVREDLNFCMDYELWLRISDKANVFHIGNRLATYRLHDTSKTGESNNFDTFQPELKSIRNEYFSKLRWKERLLLQIEGLICNTFIMAKRRGALLKHKILMK